MRLFVFSANLHLVEVFRLFLQSLGDCVQFEQILEESLSLPWGNTWESGRCRCADEIAGGTFHTHASWRAWLNGEGPDPNGHYPPSAWRAQHIAQMEGLTPLPSTPEPSDPQYWLAASLASGC